MKWKKFVLSSYRCFFIVTIVVIITVIDMDSTLQPYVLHAFLSGSRFVFTKIVGEDSASPIAVACMWSIHPGSSPGSSTDEQCELAWASHFLSLSPSLLSWEQFFGATEVVSWAAVLSNVPW